jgi:hypothetical protein
MPDTLFIDAYKIGVVSPVSYIPQGFTSQTGSLFTMFPSHVKNMYYLRDIDTPGYKLLRGVVLNVEMDSDDIVVYESNLNLYGVGNSVSDAVNEFVSMLVDIFEELVETEDILSYQLRKQLDYLRSIVAPC